MEELQFVVEQLNAEPFNLSIRAVELEQKTKTELLHLLVHVISIIGDDSEVNNSSVESKEVLADKITQFLTAHKCKLRLTDESNDTPISILHWLLQNHGYLKKRCYLSRFLLPINVPEEYLHESDSNLRELLESVRDLQAEFIERHKEFELANSSSGPSATDLKQEITKLAKEKQQLKERLQRENNLMRGNDKIKKLLEETRHLRQSEDDEINLLSQREDQLELVSLAKQRFEQVQHLSGILHVLKEAGSVDQMDTLVIDYERKLVELELKIDSRNNFNSSTINQMEGAALALEDELERKLLELDEVPHHGLDLNKLRMFQQHVDVANSKLYTSQQEMKTKKTEKNIATSHLQSALHENITKESDVEFEQFRANLSSQTNTFRKAQKEVEIIEEENAKLNKSKQKIEGELRDIVTFLKDQEESAGVSGYADVNCELEQNSKNTSSLNEKKSETLAEISSTVEKIALVLETKQNELEPKVQHLKKSRVQFLEFLQHFNTEKAAYTELEQKINAECEGLKEESTRLQDELTMNEDKYAKYCKSNLECDLKYCASMSDLEAKVNEQDEILGDLRNKHSQMVIDQEYSAKQQTLFTNLIALLDLKVKSN